MKKTILFSFLLLGLVASQAQSDKKHVEAYFSYTNFLSPVDGPFVETYLSIYGNSVKFVETEKGKVEAKVEVTSIFSKDGKIVAFDKINLHSPVISDTAKRSIFFHDQQRIALPKGKYDFQLLVVDLNDTANKSILTFPLDMNLQSDTACVSGIQLIEKYSIESPQSNQKLVRSGFEIYPLPINYIPTGLTKLPFYLELYSADKAFGKGSPYLLRMYIEEMESRSIFPEAVVQLRKTAEPITPVIYEFDISKLRTGNYYLVAEMRNKENNVISENRLYFYRENNANGLQAINNEVKIENTFVAYLKNRDTLVEYVKSLRPISGELECHFIDEKTKTASLVELQNFFLSFWLYRNTEDPQKAWADYYVEVKKVNANYGTMIRKGYSTDRGITYLRYGPPNSITSVEHEPNAYPYEIWHYYKVKSQGNCKFVFYNPDLVTNTYELLHSDVIGEKNDINWKSKLVLRNTPTQNLYDRDPDFGWGSRVNDYFNTPR